MDSNNIKWEISEGEDGYPSGGWGSRCLEMLLNPPQTPSKRLRLLAEIYNISDGQHSDELDAVFGLEVRRWLVGYWNSKLDAGTLAENNLAHTLAVLPYLIYTAFPQIQEAVLEYAQLDREAQLDR